MKLEREIEYPNRYLSRLRSRLEPIMGDLEIKVIRYIDPLDRRFYNRLRVNEQDTRVILADADEMDDIDAIHGEKALDYYLDEVANWVLKEIGCINRHPRGKC